MNSDRFQWWAMIMIFGLWLKVGDGPVWTLLWGILFALSIAGYLRARWLTRKARALKDSTD